jgi:hypothetical protein
MKATFERGMAVGCISTPAPRVFVINTCPMHVPYHLYEFGLESFRKHGAGAGYSVAFHEYYPCAGYMPRWLIGPFNSVMKWTNTGMQLAVWLRKEGSVPVSGRAPGPV